MRLVERSYNWLMWFFCWLYSLGFILISLEKFIAYGYYLTGLCLIFVSLLFLPPLRKFIYSKLNYKLPNTIRIVFVCILLIAANRLWIYEKDLVVKVNPDNYPQFHRYEPTVIRKSNSSKNVYKGPVDKVVSNEGVVMKGTFGNMTECLEGIKESTGHSLDISTDKPKEVSGRLSNRELFFCQRKESGTKGIYYEGWYTIR